MEGGREGGVTGQVVIIFIYFFQEAPSQGASHLDDKRTPPSSDHNKH